MTQHMEHFDNFRFVNSNCRDHLAFKILNKRPFYQWSKDAYSSKLDHCYGYHQNQQVALTSSYDHNQNTRMIITENDPQKREYKISIQ